MEVWKDVCEGYQVSDTGRIKSLKRNCERILTPRMHHKGYLQVHLRVDGKDVIEKIHRLVAKAFIDNPHNLPQVNHINGNKQDNRAENLEWCTNRENVKHSYDVLGRRSFQRAVLCIETGNKYVSAKEAQDKVNVDRSAIAKCCNEKRKTAGGYHWCYA